jgi:hypothetical protein
LTLIPHSDVEHGQDTPWSVGEGSAEKLAIREPHFDIPR